MENTILKLIYDYSAAGKIVDCVFVHKLIEIVVSNRELNDYVKDVSFVDNLAKEDLSVTCASYNPHSMMIKVDYHSIPLITDNYSFFDALFSTFEQILFRNLLITQIILHELEHAYQNKISEGKCDGTIEAKLIFAGLKLERILKNPKVLQEMYKDSGFICDLTKYVATFRAKYKEYYRINPIERMAEINSLKSVLNVLEQIKKYVPNLYEYQMASLGGELLRGYEESSGLGTCPTEVYLNGTNQREVWTGFDFYDPNYSCLFENVSQTYDLSRRLEYGLPIRNEEYDSTTTWLSQTNKYTILNS